MAENENDPKDDLEIESISSGDGDDAEATDLSAELAKVRAELEQAKKEYLYLRADFENYKSHMIKERSEIVRYGSERFYVELLDVLDNFDRALSFEVTPENAKQLHDGMKMTASEFNRLLERFGVKPIDPIGQPFNPSAHEALGSEESDSVAPGHILRVFKKAYKLHDRVIRPAQVIVAKEPSAKKE